MNQLCINTHTHIPFLLSLSLIPSILSLQVITEHQVELPVPYNSFLLAIYFTLDGLYISLCIYIYLCIVYIWKNNHPRDKNLSLSESKKHKSEGPGLRADRFWEARWRRMIWSPDCCPKKVKAVYLGGVFGGRGWGHVSTIH